MKFLLSVLLMLLCTYAYSQPDSAKFYFKKGIDEKTANRNLVAYQHFIKATQFDPRFVEAHLKAAYTALDMRKLDAAKESFMKANSIDPNNKDVNRKLIEMFYSYRQFQQAIDFAKKCPACVFISKIVGMSHYQLEDYGQALKYLNMAVSGLPDDPEILYNIGRTHLEMQEFAKALPHYEKAIKIDPSKNAWAYEFGLICYNIGDFKNAMRGFDLASANGYNQTNDFKENYGFAALYSGNYDVGEKLLADIIRRKPGNKDLYRSMAEIFYQKGQLEKSLDYCQKLLEFDSKDGRALYQAGLCFIKMGQKEKGQAMCDKAIEMDPSLQNLRRKKEMGI